MARTPITPQHLYVDPTANSADGIFGSVVHPSGLGFGDGVTYPHSKNRPAVLFVKAASTLTVRVLANLDWIVDGVRQNNLDFVVNGNSVRPILIPVDEYTSAGVVAVDLIDGVPADCYFAVLVFGKDSTTVKLPYETEFA